jgi:hypothetical protein
VLKPTYIKNEKGELIMRKEALLKSSQKSLQEVQVKKAAQTRGKK